jgi:hypothetical protein
MAGRPSIGVVSQPLYGDEGGRTNPECLVVDPRGVLGVMQPPPKHLGWSPPTSFQFFYFLFFIFYNLSFYNFLKNNVVFFFFSNFN